LFMVALEQSDMAEAVRATRNRVEQAADGSEQAMMISHQTGYLHKT